MIRRSITWFALGAVLGIAASMWWGPGVVVSSSNMWIGQSGRVLSEADIRGMLTGFVKFQLVVSGTAGLLLAAIANVIAYRRKAAAAQEVLSIR